MLNFKLNHRELILQHPPYSLIVSAMMSTKIWEALARTLKKASGRSKATSEPSLITDTKTYDLLAFNTVITMLTYFRAANNRLATHAPIGTSQDDRRTLRVLDAFSAVLIREHEITAVVAKPYDGSNLQVFASVIYPGNAEPPPQSGAVPSESGLWDRFIVGVNPRDNKINGCTDSLMNLTPFPIFGDYKDQVPQKLIDASNVLDTFLQNYWCVFQ